MIHRLTIFWGILIALILSGCGTPIYLQTGPETTIENQDANLAAGYMARYLMPVKKRQYLLQRIGQKIEQQPSSSMGTTGAGFFGTMALGGNPLSQSGMDTALGITLAMDVGLGLIDKFGPDGSIDFLGSIYLPEEVNGEKIENEVDALDFAREYTISRIREIAEMENRQLECLLNCGQSGSPVFKLVKNGFKGNESYNHRKVDTSGTESYDPPAIYIFSLWGKMVPARSDALRDAILGFPVKWESQGFNTWQIHMAGRLKVDSSGALVTHGTDPLYGEIPKRYWFYFYKTPLGRRVLRHLTGGPGYIIWGNGGSLTKQFSMQGRVFTYPQITQDSFIDKEIIAQP